MNDHATTNSDMVMDPGKEELQPDMKHVDVGHMNIDEHLEDNEEHSVQQGKEGQLEMRALEKEEVQEKGKDSRTAGGEANEIKINNENVRKGKNKDKESGVKNEDAKAEKGEESKSQINNGEADGQIKGRKDGAKKKKEREGEEKKKGEKTTSTIKQHLKRYKFKHYSRSGLDGYTDKQEPSKNL